MTKNYKTWVLKSKNTFELRDLSIPSLEANDVLIKFHYCALCGSDLSNFEGRRSGTYPQSLGHEFIASVEEIGVDVKTVKTGDIVTSDLNFRCGACTNCCGGKSHLCEDGQIGLFSNRAFSSHAKINEKYIFKFPTKDIQAYRTLMEPLSCIIHAFEHGAPKKTERILVLGAGSLGTCMAILLQDQGLLPSFYDPNSDRLDKLVSTFSNTTLDIEGKFDLIFDLSGSECGLELATKKINRGGKIVSMSHLDGYGSCEFLMQALMRKDVWFIVSYLNGNVSNIIRAMEILDRNWDVGYENLIDVVPINNIGKVFADRRNSPANKVIFDLEGLHSSS